MTHRVATLAALTTALACPAVADVTPQDVWANQQVLTEAFGGTITGTVTETGTGLDITDISARFDFPLGLGSMTVGGLSMVLTDQGDGTVALAYPDRFDATITFAILSEFNGSATLSVASSGQTATVSGTPTEMTYVTRYDSAAVALVDFDFDEYGDFFDIQELTFDTTGGTADYTVNTTNGLLITMSSTVEESTSRTNTSDFSGQTQDLLVQRNVVTTGEIYLPASGVDLLNLAPALRDGLSLTVATSSDFYETTTLTTYSFGNETGYQKITAEFQDQYMTFNASGLSVGGTAQNTRGEINEPILLPPFDISIDNLSAVMTLPLLQSDSPQEFALVFSGDAITVGDTLWDLLDPNGALDRSPASLAVQSSGTMTWNFEPLDFMNMEMAILTMDMPVALHSFTLSQGSVEFGGASASMTADMTFDMNDLFTIPGFPRPAGRAELQMDGVMGLLADLDATGAFPRGEMSGASFALEFLFETIGEDSLRGLFEFTEDGQLLINGTPIPL